MKEKCVWGGNFLLQYKKCTRWGDYKTKSPSYIYGKWRVH